MFQTELVFCRWTSSGLNAPVKLVNVSRTRFRLDQKRFLWFSIYSARRLWSIMNVFDCSDSPRLSDWRWTPLLGLPLLVRTESEPRPSAHGVWLFIHTHSFSFCFIGIRQNGAGFLFLFKARRCRWLFFYFFNFRDNSLRLLLRICHLNITSF